MANQVVTTNTPDFITMTIIGASLAAVAPIAYAIWVYSQFVPEAARAA